MKVVFVCLLSAMLELWLFNTRSLREVASFSFIICFSERPSSPRDEEAQVAHTHTHTPSCPLSRRFITDVCPRLPSSRRHLLLRAAGGGVKGWSFYNAMRQQMGLSIMRCVCVWFCSLLGENPDVFRVRSRGESRDSPRTKIRTQLGEVASPSQGRLIQLKPFNNCAGKLDHSAHVQTPSESLDQLTCSVHSPTLFEVGESASLQISASLKLSDHHSQDSAKLH